jgi:hypothetical protein
VELPSDGRDDLRLDALPEVIGSTVNRACCSFSSRRQRRPPKAWRKSEQDSGRLTEGVVRVVNDEPPKQLIESLDPAEPVFGLNAAGDDAAQAKKNIVVEVRWHRQSSRDDRTQGTSDVLDGWWRDLCLQSPSSEHCRATSA